MPECEGGRYSLAIVLSSSKGIFTIAPDLDSNDVPVPMAIGGGSTVWTIRVPEGHTSTSFAELVLEEAAVVVSPGSMYGPSGEGFFRISLTTPDDRITEAVERMREHLS